MTCQPIDIVRRVYRCPCCLRAFRDIEEYRGHIKSPDGQDVSELVGRLVRFNNEDCAYVYSARKCSQEVSVREIRFSYDGSSFSVGIRSFTHHGPIWKVPKDTRQEENIRRSFIENTLDYLECFARDRVPVTIPWYVSSNTVDSAVQEEDVGIPEDIAIVPSVEERVSYVCPICRERFQTEKRCELHISYCSKAEGVRKLRGCHVVLEDSRMMTGGIVSDVSVEDGELEVIGLKVTETSDGFKVTECRGWISANGVLKVTHSEVIDNIVERCLQSIEIDLDHIVEGDL